MRSISLEDRRSHTLDAIIPPVRQGILATLFLRPEKWWYLTELSRALGVTPSSLQRAIDSLVEVGVIERRVDGRRSYLKANEGSPIFSELRGLFEKTSGIVASIRETIAGVEGIRIAFIYGSVAREEESAGSDVDVMVIGDVSSLELSEELWQIEKKLGRPINRTVYTWEDFLDSVAKRKHFLMTVLRGRKIMLVGSEDELESIARGAEIASASDEQAGTR